MASTRSDVAGSTLPDRIGLFHRRDGGATEWNVLLESANFSLTVTDDRLGYGDVRVAIEQDGQRTAVGDFFPGSVAWENTEPPYTVPGGVRTDSLQIVAQHNATVYEGLRPGEAEWVVIDLQNFGGGPVIYRSPVTLIPRWFSPNVLALQDCSASESNLRPGDQTTVSATIENPSFDPVSGDAVGFVGSASETIGFEIPPRGGADVEASFEVSESGRFEYGFDLENVAHNY